MKKIVLACLLLGLSFGLQAQTDFIHKNISDEASCRIWVNNKLEAMTLKQKIGQLFIHTVAPLSRINRT